MSIQNILNHLPKYAHNISKNIEEIFFQCSSTLKKDQIFGIVLTAGYALKDECLLNYIRPEAKQYLDSHKANACKIAISTVSMASTYHNFIHNIDDSKIQKISSYLSLDNLSNHTIDEKDFLIYCFVASTVNECKYYINKYITSLKQHHITSETIHDITKIVSVIKAAGDVLAIERMRSYDFVVREESF